ncbi:putative Neuronal calcium sensor 2 [Hypsibius exemplaris]|uniref:Neuronal calcium sensor 2 n=1 Tax=Hypsibius exemplaris TaxID=2072580 RepID=A0A1W0X4B6_HYPEX|nr:putative Neuronal calcium sensor 2 [Hypsibius exemplaris]
MGNKETKTAKTGDVAHSPKLKKADLEFLKANTTFDEETITEWYTEFLRDCRNGKLSPKQFMEVYQVICPGGEAKEFSRHVFRTFDKDRNGFIDFKEFLMAVNVTSSGTVEQKLKWAFSMVDIDGNGTIDLSEMTKVISAIQEMSGALTTVSAAAAGGGSEDAVDGPPSTPLPQPLSAHERAEQIFTKMDTDGNGILDEQEFVFGCLADSSLVQMLVVSGNWA